MTSARYTPIALVAAVVCASAVPSACGSTALSKPEEHNRLEIVSFSAAEQEAAAMQLPSCEVDGIETSEWTVRTFPPYFRVLLPADFTVQDDVPDLQQLWVAPDGSLFLVTQHEGDGRVTTGLGFDEPAEMAEEAACRIMVGGRTAALYQYVAHLRGQTYFCASLDAGLREGLGIGVAILAASAPRRAELIAAIRTISIADVE